MKSALEIHRIRGNNLSAHKGFVRSKTNFQRLKDKSFFS